MQPLHSQPEAPRGFPSVRDLVTPLFRHRRVMLMTVAIGLLALIALVAALPPVYEAEMKVLVHRERVDSIVTSDPEPERSSGAEVTESEVYSEIELLQGRELLQSVVQAIGVDRFTPPASDNGDLSKSARLDRALRSVQRSLTVEPLRKTTMIRIAYRDGDPQVAAAVLQQLGAAYLDKHLQVHRPQGARAFFAAQAEHFAEERRAAEAQLKEFVERERVVSTSTEKTDALRALSEFRSLYQQTEAERANASRRLDTLQAQLGSSPERQVTQIRNAGNVELLRGLQQQILQLEISREEMLRKFTPAYPPFAQLERQLAQLREAAQRAQQDPLREETTDQNPTFLWLRTEAARARTERDALGAKAAALQQSIAGYQDRAQRLETLNVEQETLLRAVQSAIENQTLYRRKQEEARVSDALDSTRIANVTITDPPVQPQRPAGSSRAAVLFAGLLFVFASAVAAAHITEALTQRLSTPAAVSRALNVPVLATLPAGRD